LEIGQECHSWPNTSDIDVIDDILEKEERRKEELEKRPPFDINFIFDAALGAPDDCIVHCLTFLPTCEHWKLLCISFTTHQAIIQRTDMWRQMCPSHWILPSRPRKPWHNLYISKLREEAETARKRSDDILIKVHKALSKGDNLHTIEKIINKTQFPFDINYVSGGVMDRNSILNLAVINQRHKCTKWLIEEKHADIESADCGNFTPLLNAAYAGDKYLVSL